MWIFATAVLRKFQVTKLTWAIAFLVVPCVAHAANEVWICGIPTLVDVTHINFFYFDIVGDQVVQNSWAKDAKVQFPIVRNDDRTIVFDFPDTTTLAVIDKILA